MIRLQNLGDSNKEFPFLAIKASMGILVISISDELAQVS